MMGNGIDQSIFGMTRLREVNEGGGYWNEQPKSAVQKPKLVNNEDTNNFSPCMLD